MRRPVPPLIKRAAFVVALALAHLRNSVSTASAAPDRNASTRSATQSVGAVQSVAGDVLQISGGRGSN